ncbi:hypothetical protein [Virgisporangium ochraceum]|uniref:hypothetical protein n=1 Tax=Virgisporangium ochraceum TaxID=65505 RepID=UPI001940BA1F|nr:hypothetical protein [Virgisporangium ochraceum]
MTSPLPPPAHAGEPAQPLVVREPTVAIIPTQYRPPDRGGYSGYAAPGYTPPPNYYQPVIPSQYPSQYPRPVYLPPPRRRRRGLAAAVVVALLLVLGAGGGAAAFVAAGPDGVARSLGGPGKAGTAPDARDTAIIEVLNRRSKAVNSRDKTAFMADIDKTDAELTKRQETVYENLIKLPFAEFSYKIGGGGGYDDSIPTELKTKYGDQVRAPGVAIIHRIEGVDNDPVAAPWVPIFALVSSQWRLVGEAKGKELPSGVGGQPWDAGPIIVEKGEKVVGIFSANNRSRAGTLIRIADEAMDQVALVRPNQWVGKVFMTAVRDRAVFDAYFGASPERVDQVAAIAVPHYDDVPDWNGTANYSATRVIFNPDEIDEDNDVLSADMSHEFTHAAMAPVTTGWTPTWLVEGFAEYVSYKGAQIDTNSLKRALDGVQTENLFAGEQFYDEPMNYITAWLANRMISETYGETKLIQLYERFQQTSNEEVVISQVLGVPRATLIKNWQDYVAKQKR